MYRHPRESEGLARSMARPFAWCDRDTDMQASHFDGGVRPGAGSALHRVGYGFFTTLGLEDFNGRVVYQSAAGIPARTLRLDA